MRKTWFFVPQVNGMENYLKGVFKRLATSLATKIIDPKLVGVDAEVSGRMLK